MHHSENIHGLESSATLAVAMRCRALRMAGRTIVDLGVGELDFRTPEFASQAGIAAIRQGLTQYTPVGGLPELRASIAGFLSRRSGRPLSQEGVVVTAGAKQALFNSLFSLFGPGDEVLLPVPCWTSYPPLLRLARATPVEVRTDAASSFRVDPAQLERAATNRTRGVILNSPSNPAGTVYSVAELTAIAEWAAARGVWLVADEIYNRISYDAERAPSVLDLPPALLERTVLVDGVSKAFAMTGWRIGFSWSGDEAAARMIALQSHVTSNASAPAQFAALAAFRDEPRVGHAVRAMVDVLRSRRDFVLRTLAERLPHLRGPVPAGAFYAFLRVDHCFQPGRADSTELCNWLLDTAGVALVPGAAFGCDDYVRLSFAAPQEELVTGLDRLATSLARYEPAVSA
jgi:aspartate aminotransferase